MPDVVLLSFIGGYALEKEGRGAPKGTLWKKGFPVCEFRMQKL